MIVDMCTVATVYQEICVSNNNMKHPSDNILQGQAITLRPSLQLRCAQLYIPAATPNSDWEVERTCLATRICIPLYTLPILYRVRSYITTLLLQ